MPLEAITLPPAAYDQWTSLRPVRYEIILFPFAATSISPGMEGVVSEFAGQRAALPVAPRPNTSALVYARKRYRLFLAAPYILGIPTSVHPPDITSAHVTLPRASTGIENP